MVQFSFRFACYHVIAVKLHTENKASSCFFWKSLVAVKKAGLNVEDVQSRALRRAGRAAAAEFFHAPPPPKFLATAGANRRRG